MPNIKDGDPRGPPVRALLKQALTGSGSRGHQTARVTRAHPPRHGGTHTVPADVLVALAGRTHTPGPPPPVWRAYSGLWPASPSLEAGSNAGMAPCMNMESAEPADAWCGATAAGGGAANQASTRAAGSSRAPPPNRNDGADAGAVVGASAGAAAGTDGPAVAAVAVGTTAGAEAGTDGAAAAVVPLARGAEGGDAADEVRGATAGRGLPRRRRPDGARSAVSPADAAVVLPVDAPVPRRQAGASLAPPPPPPPREPEVERRKVPRSAHRSRSRSTSPLELELELRWSRAPLLAPPAPAPTTKVCARSNVAARAAPDQEAGAPGSAQEV